MLTLVHLMVSLGMLVIVPLGLSLVQVPGGTTARRWWLAAAVPGVLSLWLGRGPLSVTLASIYLAGTLVLVGLATADLVRRRRLRAREVALYTALVTPAIAALALVAERSSYELFGFNLTVLSLTVAHFHFAGFAAALVACLVVESDSDRATTAAAVSVPLGTGIVLLGFFLGDPVELLGAAVLTAGMWLVGWAMWRRSRTAERVPKVLLVISAGTLVVTMLLALSWALGHVAATPYLPLRWMVATHGVANALGFALCGLLAWRLLKESDEAR
ncbi:YndJ family protein [Kribbella sp. CA-293567]|uniref:YndJ family protein n=1 Tax=Kribbella sp. CA-293567 TaxID=3002436 RepID=UPI0022DD2A5E|nr:YndJ family protein [Kribbella sp. CA-293567]WBQ04282.1 YndJ family protein [Kribbella sp. CA-293567]